MENEEKNKILLAVCSQTMADMRSRRLVDQKILTYCISIISIFAGGSLTFLARAEITGFPKLLFVSVVALFLCLVWLYAEIRIYHEHQIYKKLGERVVDIWEHFKLFDEGAYYDEDGKSVLPDDAKELGQGDGYKKMLELGFIVTLMAIVIVVIGAILI